MSAWTIIGLMSCVALMGLMLALAPRRAGAEVSAAAADSDHYQAQIDEIERLKKLGALGEREAESARIEAARRLIATRPEAAEGWSQEAQRRLRIGLSVAFLIIVPAISAGIYNRFGNPTLGDVPLSERRAEEPQLFAALDALTNLEARIAVNPDDGEAQDTLATIYMQLGRYGEAARAYQAATRILGETPARLSGRAEAIVSSENGIVTPEARVLFARALELDPAYGAARFYGGMALKQDGRKAEAAAIWQALWLDTPDEGLRKVIEAQLREVGSAPPGKTTQ